jgi:protein-S-isoprenylcysteine O-methyltransferase Ste14
MVGQGNFGLVGVAIFAVMIIGILDSGRFFWTETPSMYIYIIGYLIYSISVVFLIWPMYVNKFFSSMVRIQKDRNQTVCQEGPYKIVRHPGYSAVIIMSPSIALTFGSFVALIPGFISIILIIIRTYLEDITLQKELKGYKEYTKKVKYRLIPGVW